MSETVLICGSRDWPDPMAVRDFVDSLDDDATVIVGGAGGVDEFAEHRARRRGLRLLVHCARWRDGRGAGFDRNLRMLDENPHRVVAFHHAGSRGTQHTIENARWRGLPVEVFTS